MAIGIQKKRRINVTFPVTLLEQLDEFLPPASATASSSRPRSGSYAASGYEKCSKNSERNPPGKTRIIPT